MRPDDVVARFGGDEFTVLCQNVTSVDAVEQIAERIAEVIAKPVPLMEGEVFVTVVDRHRDGRRAWRHARDAPAQRRRRDVPREGERPRPRRGVRHPDPSPCGRRPPHRQRAAPRHRARRAAHALPTDDRHRAAARSPGSRRSSAGSIPNAGWSRPRSSSRSPRRRASSCRSVRGRSRRRVARRSAWHDAACDGTRLSMSVNLSPRQLAEPSLPTEVARVLSQTGLSADSLWLEITETTLMRDVESALERAQRAAHARPAPRGRRLRHRLLVAGVPGAAARRVAEDRPVVRRGRRSTLRQQRDRHRDRGPGARAAAQDGRRRDRAARTAPLVDRDRLRVRPGLSLRPARPAEFYGADPIQSMTVRRRPTARVA